jgi:hypothetical protein
MTDRAVVVDDRAEHQIGRKQGAALPRRIALH